MEAGAAGRARRGVVGSGPCHVDEHTSGAPAEGAATPAATGSPGASRPSVDSRAGGPPCSAGRPRSNAACSSPSLPIQGLLPGGEDGFPSTGQTCGRSRSGGGGGVAQRGHRQGRRGSIRSAGLVHVQRFGSGRRAGRRDRSRRLPEQRREVLPRRAARSGWSRTCSSNSRVGPDGDLAGRRTGADRGGTSGRIRCTTAEIFDPVRPIRCHADRESLDSRGRFHTATLLADGRVLVAGGHGTSCLQLGDWRPPRSTTRRRAASRRRGTWRARARTRRRLAFPTVACSSPAAMAPTRSPRPRRSS